MGQMKSYLIRAVHQWAVDNGLTPHVLVDTTVAGVEVPREYVENGQIVLNVHPQATGGLVLGDDSLMFSARFAGHSRAIQIPVEAVGAIFAKENGQGISFPTQALAHNADAAGDDNRPGASKPGPNLRIIK